jgi:hypothetical protein
MWKLYLCGVRDVIHAARLVDTSAHDQIFIALFGWVYYHESLAAFSILHWRRYEQFETAYIDDVGEEYARSKASNCSVLKVSGLIRILPRSQEINVRLTHLYRYRMQYVRHIRS